MKKQLIVTFSPLSDAEIRLLEAQHASEGNSTAGSEAAEKTTPENHPQENPAKPVDTDKVTETTDNLLPRPINDEAATDATNAVTAVATDADTQEKDVADAGTPENNAADAGTPENHATNAGTPSDAESAPEKVANIPVLPSKKPELSIEMLISRLREVLMALDAKKENFQPDVAVTKDILSEYADFMKHLANPAMPFTHITNADNIVRRINLVDITRKELAMYIGNLLKELEAINNSQKAVELLNKFRNLPLDSTAEDMLNMLVEKIQTGKLFA